MKPSVCDFLNEIYIVPLLTVADKVPTISSVLPETFSTPCEPSCIAAALVVTSKSISPAHISCPFKSPVFKLLNNCSYVHPFASDGDTLLLGEAEAEGDKLGETEGLTEEDGDKLGDTELDGLTDGLTDEDGDTDGLWELLGEILGEIEDDGLTDEDGETEGLWEELGDIEGETEDDGLTELLGLTEAEGLTLGDSELLGLTLADGDTEADGLRLGLTLALSPPLGV